MDQLRIANMFNNPLPGMGEMSSYYPSPYPYQVCIYFYINWARFLHLNQIIVIIAAAGAISAPSIA